MKIARYFKVDAVLQSAIYENESNSWALFFTNSIHLSIYSFWRILENGKIISISTDHRHQFGHAAPVDLVAALSDQLNGCILHAIIVKEGTGDLVLRFSKEKDLEVYISSSGYENYDLTIGSKRFIGLGSGELFEEK
jgi:hypothetical protein